jgi:hypothetical protein
MNNLFEMRHLFGFIYWYAIGTIQEIDRIKTFARELHRLAACLEDDKRYKPDLEALGWPKDVIAKARE